MLGDYDEPYDNEMVTVSVESSEQTTTRLKEVISKAELSTLPGVWSYFESPIDQPPVLTNDVLAVVRDEDRWSILKPAGDAPSDEEKFGLFSFHFKPGLDNSGFVGWLAAALKERLGTGVIVICGSNSGRGGIYDYWGCPIHLLEAAVEIVKELSAGFTIRENDPREPQ